MATEKVEEKHSSIVAEKAEYDTKTKQLNIIYWLEKNSDDFTPTYRPGESEKLEIKTEDGWEKVPKYDGEILDYWEKVNKQGENVVKIDIGKFYGDFVSGRYRHTMTFMVDSGKNSIDVSVEFEVSNELRMEIVNNPIKLSDSNVFLNAKIINTTGNDYTTTYVFGLIERYENGEWVRINVDYLPSIEILGIIDSNTEFKLRIGLDGISGNVTVSSNELVCGHYRYSHEILGLKERYITAEFDIVE